MNKTDNKCTKSYKNAKGKLKATLRNDLLFHYVTQKSDHILKNLICSLKGLNPDEVRDVVIMNPIDYAEAEGKQVILDIRVLMNDAEILDIELQMYHDENWKERSLLYLCRSYDSLGTGDDYSELKPTTLVAIVDENMFPDNPEFYSRFLMLHEEKHYPYSTNLRLNVLYLNQIELATDDDRANNLDYWAQLFKSDTWEELQALAEENPIGEEVAEVMYEGMIQSQEKTFIEGHQRYIDFMRAAKNSGYSSGYKKGVEETQAKVDAIIAAKDEALAAKDEALAAKDYEIARLKALLDER